MDADSISRLTQNFFYTFGSQMVALVAGLVRALIVPLLLSINGYAYWQVYVFYTVYVGLATLGYNDGLYLKYGGKSLAELPLKRIRIGNWVYLGLISITAIVVLLLSSVIQDTNRALIFAAISANILLLGAIANISLTLQAVNEIKAFAVLSAVEKLFFLCLFIILVNPEYRNFETLIIIDLVSKTIVTSFLLIKYRALFLGAMSAISLGLRIFLDSANAGIRLLAANFLGMLVLGVGRLILEYRGDIDSYAHYAFATSLANIVLVCLSAASIVLYPALKQRPDEQHLGLFDQTIGIYKYFSVLFLIFYFPSVFFIYNVIPKYSMVVEILNAMFVVIVLQGKMQVVCNTYYKVLRLESSMFIANLFSLAVVSFLSLVSYMLTQSILSIAYSAVVGMAFRVYLSENSLRSHLSGRGLAPKDFLEPASFGIFLIITTCFEAKWAGLAWLLVVAVFLVSGRRQVARVSGLGVRSIN